MHPHHVRGAAARRRGRFLFLLLACAGPALATGLPAAADCAGEPARVLQGDAGAPAHARALWLDATTLRWPGAPAHGRFRLYHAPAGGLVARPGAPLRGAAGMLELRLLPPDPADHRLAHAGPGPRLAVDARIEELRQLQRQALVLVREDGHGRVLEATALQAAAALDALYPAAASAPGLGAAPSADGTGFGLWAPTAQAVHLCLYPRSPDAAAQVLPARREAATGIWRLQHPDDLSGRYYTWLVDVYVRGHGLVRNRVTDPYAVSLDADSRRTYIADLDDPALAPPGWDSAARPPAAESATDMAVYELHVRDFSIGDEAVAADRRGRYLAFADPGSRGMAHLRGLAKAGLGDVHLLPVYDFATVPEAGCVQPQVPQAAADAPDQQAAVMAVADHDCFNWGYDPFHFGAPEGSYASDPDDGAVRIREFRAMVMALHAAGLRVGMDVVYNHTYAAGQDPASVLDRIVPGYYHRLDGQGRIERSTCCENTATEHAMMARLMIDTAERWVRHYRIDSFRFDLMGHQPLAAMEALQQRVDAAAGRHVPLLGEGWNFGEVADGARFVQAAQLSLAGSGIGSFSDRARDALRGGGAGDSGRDKLARQGWLNGLGYAPNAQADAAAGLAELPRIADLVRVGLAGSLADYVLHTHDGRHLPLREIDYNGQPAGYTAAPGEAVNYVENHDNETLYDLNALRLPRDTSTADRARVQLLGMAATAFSQGVAYYHAGIELLRSKSLDRNSFNSGDWFNRIDWSGRTNYFGSGLPPASGNGDDWPWLAPLLADPALRPAPEDIALARDGLRDLLAIRASSSLFRLRTAGEVRQRLSFPNSGPGQNPRVIAGLLDGRGHPGAGFGQVLYLLNASPDAEVLRLPVLRGQPWVLHPVLRAASAADPRARLQARFDPADGSFRLPPRSVLVYVLESRP